MMACRSSHCFYRRITFFAAIFVFFQNVGTASLMHRLPDDPLNMSAHLSLYSWFASLLAILGVIGAKKHNGTLVAIFANFLLIDVILCAIPRILAMFFFPEIRGLICSADSINARLQSLQASGFFSASDNQEGLETHLTEECTNVVLALQVVAGLIVAFATIVQFGLAIKVRTYSSLLQDEQDTKKAQLTSIDGMHFEKLQPYHDYLHTSASEPMDEKRVLDV